MSARILLAILVCHLCVARRVSAEPSLVWISSPVLPGQTVLAQGVGLTTGLQLELCPQESLGSSPACDVVSALTVAADGSSLKFTLPATLPLQPLGVRLHGTPAMLWLNAPRVMLAIGEQAAAFGAVPGDVLRISGHGLAFGGPQGCAAYLGRPGLMLPAPPILTLQSLVKGAANTHKIPARHATCNSALFDIPLIVPAGDYQITLTSDLPCSVPVPINTGDAFRIVAAAWTPNTQLSADNETALRSALQVATQWGGALITLCGNCEITLGTTLSLPNNTVLEGQSSTRLVWTASAQSPLSPVIGLAPSGSASVRVGLRHLTIVVRAASSSVVDWTQTVDSFVENVGITIEDSLLSGALAMGPCFTMQQASSLRLVNNTCTHGGNCSLMSWPHNTAIYTSDAHGLVVSNNTFMCLCQGYSFDSSSQVSITGNRWTSLGKLLSEGSGMSTFRTGVLEHVYFGNNTVIGNPSAVKRFESFTFDGPGGRYFGFFTAVSPDGRVLTISQKITPSKWLPCINLSLVVLAGTGMGTTARVTSCGQNTIVLRDPLPIALATAEQKNPSLLTVAPYRGMAVFEGNFFINGTTFQYYGAGIHLVTAANKFQHFGNVGSWGLWYQVRLAATFWCFPFGFVALSTHVVSLTPLFLFFFSPYSLALTRLFPSFFLLLLAVLLWLC